MKHRRGWRYTLLSLFLAVSIGMAPAGAQEVLIQPDTEAYGTTEKQTEGELTGKVRELAMLENISNGVDIVAVLDGSRSIRPWKTQRDAAAKTLISLQGGIDSTMGVVFFSGGFLAADSPAYVMSGKNISEAQQQEASEYAQQSSYQNISVCSPMFSLNRVGDRQTLLETLDQLSAHMDEQVERIPLDQVSTNLATGITSALNMLEQGSNDKKVILLFSDGINDTRNDIESVERVYDAQTREAVHLAKEAGVELYVVYLMDDEATGEAELIKAALSEQTLLKLVNYYQEGDTYNDRFYFLKTSNLSGLEESFFSVLHQNTNIAYQEKSVNDSGTYTLTDLPQSGAQNVSLVFRGTDVQIIDVKKNGSSILSEEILYNYGTGANSVSAVFLSSVSAEDSWQIITNSAEERCYEVFNNTLQVGMTTDGDRLRVALYDLEGQAVTPEKGMTIDIDYIDAASGTKSAVVQNLKPVGSEFVTEKLDVVRDVNHSYQIILKNTDGTAVGSCIWAGEIRQVDPGVTPGVQEGTVLNLLMWPVAAEEGIQWIPDAPSGSFALKKLIGYEPEDPETLTLQIKNMDGQTLAWHMNPETGKIYVTDPQFLTETPYLPWIDSEIRVEFQEEGEQIQSGTVKIREWNMMFVLAAAAAFLVLLMILIVRSAAKKKKRTKQFRTLENQTKKMKKLKNACDVLQKGEAAAAVRWQDMQERLGRLNQKYEAKAGGSLSILDQYPRLESVWSEFEEWLQQNSGSGTWDSMQELQNEIRYAAEAFEAKKSIRKVRKMMKKNQELMDIVQRQITETEEYLEERAKKAVKVEKFLEDVELEFVPFSCSLLIETPDMAAAVSFMDHKMKRRSAPVSLGTCRVFPGDGQKLSACLPEGMAQCFVIGSLEGVVLVNRGYVPVKCENRNCAWEESPRGNGWKMLRLEPGTYRLEAEPDEMWVLQVMDPEKGEA